MDALKYLQSVVGMDGWVTWLASTGLIVIALMKFYQGQNEAGMMLISVATGLVGIGRKLTKSTQQKENKDGIS